MERTRLSLTHSALTELVQAGTEDSTPAFEAISRAVSHAASGLDLGVRHRHELRRTATQIATYLHLLVPSNSEFEADAATIFWATDQGRVADLLVLTDSTAAVVTAALRRTARALLEEGSDAVRLCKLAAPLRSLLFTDPQAPPVDLYGSRFWFGLRSHSADDVAGLGGGS
jgi:hypothetical protein